jgi:uncharacterized RDD family membrane protein YckC
MEPHQYQSPTDIFPQSAPAQYAGFWERFGAAFLDGLIVGIPMAIVQYALGEYDRADTGLVDMYLTPGSILNFLVSWLYSASMESSPRQATLGKRALGLKVTNTEGGRISFGQATGRHFGKYVSMIILFIGYLMMLWDDRKQTLHDKMAGTLVVKG